MEVKMLIDFNTWSFQADTQNTELSSSRTGSVWLKKLQQNKDGDYCCDDLSHNIRKTKTKQKQNKTKQNKKERKKDQTKASSTRSGAEA